MAHQTISATEFKAKCLALIDEVNQQGGTITITKRGKPVATLGAVKKAKVSSMEGSWARLFPELLETLDDEDFDFTHLYKPERVL